MTFDSLGLAPHFLRAVADEGYTEPTPIQLQAIPLVLAGRDLLAAAQTGTGKTAAFVLPMLQRLEESHPSAGVARPVSGRPVGPPVRALVLTPTRELALQVEESVRTYGRHRPVRSVAIYGGVGFNPQASALRKGAPVVVATPGRLLDHVSQRTIDLSRVEIVVLDEADRMLDMGFIRDIRRVLGLLPARRQSLLFSATFSDDIRDLAGGLLFNPATVDVAPRNTAAELVDQLVIPVDRERKRDLLTHLVGSGKVSQALVFTRTKHGANRLAEQLGRDGIAAAAIHGNKSQSQRIHALDSFKAGRVGILVATDIAARGIDIEALPHVVNYELPMVASDYVHRIGRTGRAGTGGRAISLVSGDEAELLHAIQRLLRRPLPSSLVVGFEPVRSAQAEPFRARSNGPVRRVGDARGRAHAPRPAGRPTGADSRGGAGRRPIALPGERLRRAQEPPGPHDRSSSAHQGGESDGQALALRARTARRRERADQGDRGRLVRRDPGRDRQGVRERRGGGPRAGSAGATAEPGTRHHA